MHALRLQAFADSCEPVEHKRGSGSRAIGRPRFVAHPVVPKLWQKIQLQPIRRTGIDARGWTPQRKTPRRAEVFLTLLPMAGGGPFLLSE